MTGVRVPCLGATAMFFQERGDPDRGATPKKVCATCPFDSWFKCLDFAITNCEKFGVWGGYSTNEREEIARVWKKRDWSLIMELRKKAQSALRREVA